MEKHIKHRKMVISTNSLILIGMLCFCYAKTIYFSLAKQYSSFLFDDISIKYPMNFKEEYGDINNIIFLQKPQLFIFQTLFEKQT